MSDKDERYVAGGEWKTPPDDDNDGMNVIIRGCLIGMVIEVIFLIVAAFVYAVFWG